MSSIHLKDGWNKQKLIDYVRANFKGKSVRDGACLYRGPEGKKCAIGLFIPDSEVSLLSSIEYSTVASVWAKINKFLPFTSKYLALEFQRAHDCLLEHASVETQTNELINWIERNVSNV